MINYLLPILFGRHLAAEIAGIMYDLQLSKYVDIWGTIHGYFVKNNQRTIYCPLYMTQHSSVQHFNFDRFFTVKYFR